MKRRECLRVVLVRFLRPGEAMPEREKVPLPSVRAYCSAMRLCWSGQAPQGLLVSRESVSVCKWCPAALGLKPRENKLEQKLWPVPAERYDAVYLYSPTAPGAPRDLPTLADRPDVAVVVGRGADISTIVSGLQEGELATEFAGQLTTSALSTMTPRRHMEPTARVRRAAKRASLAVLNWLFSTPVLSNRASVAVITQPFKSAAFSRGADAVIRLTMAGASACLNTSVIPLVTGKANASFVDAGTIAWAGLKARHRLLGMPIGLYRRIESRLATAVTS